MFTTQTDTPTIDSNKFVLSLTELINEIRKTKAELFKSAKNKKLWKDDYDNIISKLTDLLELSHDNLFMAINEFRKLDISNYDSFTNYMYNRDINAMSLRKGSNERTKLLRARRKGKRCPECHMQLSSSSGSFTCKNCGYTSNSKDGSPDYRSNTDSTKHTCKHLDALSGTKKAPANILKIIKYVSLWLTDMHYIADWLDSEHKLSQFVNKFNNLTNEHYTTASFRKLKFDRTPDNMWEYSIYKIITDELYALLEKAKRISKMKSSNMESLDEEHLKHVIHCYAESMRKNIISNEHIENIENINISINTPKIDEIFSLDDSDYEIGLYINALSLIADEEDKLDNKNMSNDVSSSINGALNSMSNMTNLNNMNSTNNLANVANLNSITSTTNTSNLSSIKLFVDKEFGKSITMPGLMFNFNDIYCQSDNVPKRYNFTQEYIYISHETFNVSYIDISLPDKDAIIKLVLMFNEFYKKSSFARTGKECNAPLFCCALVSILTHFRYFEKYMDMLKFIPTKDKNTSLHIKSEWFKFLCAHPELKEKYNKEVLDDGEVKYVDESKDSKQSKGSKRLKQLKRAKNKKALLDSSEDELNKLKCDKDRDEMNENKFNYNGYIDDVNDTDTVDTDDRGSSLIDKDNVDNINLFDMENDDNDNIDEEDNTDNTDDTESIDNNDENDDNDNMNKYDKYDKYENCYNNDNDNEYDNETNFNEYNDNDDEDDKDIYEMLDNEDEMLF